MVGKTKKRKVTKKKVVKSAEQTRRYPSSVKAEDAARRLRRKGYRARVSKETEKKGIYRVRFKKNK